MNQGESLASAPRDNFADVDRMVAARVGGPRAAIQPDECRVEHGSTGHHWLTGNAAELVGLGTASEAAGETLTTLTEHVHRERARGLNRRMRLQPRLDADQHQGRS